MPAGASDLARFQAVEAQQKALVAQCEKKPETRCQFAEFDGGLFFTLTEFEEIKDVRLVYAPPLGVGNYGGETDNWSWPRHTGDFSLLRAYKDGQPYRPRYFFPVSTKGVREGDAVAVLGYPGRSYRSWIADEMKEREVLWFPAVRDLYAEWIRILEEEGARSPEAGIAVADDLRGLENTQKNAGGPDRGPAPRPDRREAAQGRRARARLGGEAAGRDARARGLRGPREAERGEARHLGPRLPARHGLPRAARPALAAHPRPPLDRRDEARRRAGDRLHGARPRPHAGPAGARPEALRRGRGPAAVPIVGEARPRPARRPADPGGGRGVRRRRRTTPRSTRGSPGCAGPRGCSTSRPARPCSTRRPRP